MISSKKYVDQTLKKYHLEANKALGQNFLVEESIVDTMIERINFNNQSVVIEIGPGLGALTEKLVLLAKKIYVIEIDEHMCQILNDTFNDCKQLTIIHSDFLKLDLDNLFTQQLKNEKDIHILSNLPYYITSQILNKLILNNYSFSSLTVMMQKEVGKKLIHPQTKESTPLTTILNYKYHIDVVTHVSKNAYLPRPNIDSIVLKITPVTPLFKADNEFFFIQLVKDLYKERRKTIANNLQSYFSSKEEVYQFLKQLNISEIKRIEQITIEELVAISNQLGK